MTYLLDNNVVQHFLHAKREPQLREAASQVPLAVADAVFKEACVDGKDQERKRRARILLDDGPIGRLSIDVGSSQDITLQALVSRISTTRGDGERASIALAAHDPSLVFVANDHNGLWLALRELHTRGERLVGVPVFLRRLREDAALDLDSIDDVLREYLRPNHTPPTWWSPWRSGQQ